jgi:hypothetical protein
MSAHVHHEVVLGRRSNLTNSIPGHFSSKNDAHGAFAACDVYMMNKGDRKSMSTHLTCEPRGNKHSISSAAAEVGKRRSHIVKCDKLKRGKKIIF